MTAFYTFSQRNSSGAPLGFALEEDAFFTLLLAFFWCPLPASAAPKDLVLVLDNSGSMKNNDPDFFTGVAVRKFLDQLDDDSRVAILIFDQPVRLAMPLTTLNDSSRKQFLQSLEQANYKDCTLTVRPPSSAPSTRSR